MDRSLIKLFASFSDAKFDRMKDTQIYYSSGVCLLPTEKYLQETKSKVNINFGNSYKVEIINCNETVLADVTASIYLYTFQDHNGIYQIAFEILPLNVDFGFEKVYFKFTGLSNDVSFYSNDFILTNEIENRSIRIDYKNYSYEDDLYTRYNSARFMCFFNGIEERQESSIYTEIEGNVRKSRVIQNFSYTYKIERLNTFGFTNLANALTSDLVYIDCERATVLDELKSGERLGKTNLITSDFNAIINENETFTYTNQIAPIFQAIQIIPSLEYTLFTIPTNGSVIFNDNILSSGGLSLYNSDGNIFIQDVTYTILDNTINFSMPILANGNYNFVLLNVESILLDKIDVNWSFSIANGEFEPSEFDNNEFLV